MEPPTNRRKALLPFRMTVAELRAAAISSEPITDVVQYCAGGGSASVDYIASGSPGCTIYRGIMKKGPHKGETVAVKVLRPSQALLHHYFREPYMLHLTNARVQDCSGLLQLYGACVDKASWELILVTTFAPGGDLFDHFYSHRESLKSRVTESFLARILRTIVTSVLKLHKAGILHLDLKPENILLREKSEGGAFNPEKDLIVCDVGQAALVEEGLEGGMEESQRRNHRGTPGYAAPEQYYSPYTWCKASDAWAIGSIAYALLTFCALPFPRANGDDKPAPAPSTAGALKESIQALRANPAWTNLSDDAKDFILRCWTYDPLARLSVEDMLDHPWLRPGTIHRAQSLDQTILNIQSKSALNTLLHSVLGAAWAGAVFLAGLAGFQRANTTFGQDELSILQQRFKEKMDASQCVTLADFCTLIASSSLGMNAFEAGKMFRWLDRNEDGRVSYVELKFGLDALRKGEETALDLVFDMFDHNNDGRISVEEMVAMLQQVGLSARDSTATPAFPAATTSSSSHHDASQQQASDTAVAKQEGSTSHGSAPKAQVEGCKRAGLPLPHGSPAALPSPTSPFPQPPSSASSSSSSTSSSITVESAVHTRPLLQRASTVTRHVLQSSSLVHAGFMKREEFKAMVKSNEVLSQVLLRPLKALAQEHVKVLTESLLQGE